MYVRMMSTAAANIQRTIMNVHKQFRSKHTLRKFSVTRTSPQYHKAKRHSSSPLVPFFTPNSTPIFHSHSPHAIHTYTSISFTLSHHPQLTFMTTLYYTTPHHLHPLTIITPHIIHTFTSHTISHHIHPLTIVQPLLRELLEPLDIRHKHEILHTEALHEVLGDGRQGYGKKEGKKNGIDRRMDGQGVERDSGG